jgi:peptidoglycan/xylan/chitin deacetylase (PgdA/CDA1 family)
MTTRNGPIVAMPYTLEIGDIPVFLFHGGSGEDFERMIVDQFDMLYEEGATTPRFLSIALHPFLVGHPFRARHLERALQHIRKRQDVWITTGSAIMDWYRSSASRT